MSKIKEEGKIMSESKILTVEEMRAASETVTDWMREAGLWLENRSYQEDNPQIFIDHYEDQHIAVDLWTAEHHYAIYVRPSKNYMGCIMYCRTQRAGENWLRMSDLPDGPFNKDTWDAIMRAIVRTSLVPAVSQTEEDGYAVDEEENDAQ